MMQTSIAKILFMVHGLYAEKPDGKRVIDEFRNNLLGTYKEFAEDWKTSWLLDVEQQLTLTDSNGNEVLGLSRDKDDKR